MKDKETKRQLDELYQGDDFKEKSKNVKISKDKQKLRAIKGLLINNNKFNVKSKNWDTTNPLVQSCISHRKRQLLEVRNDLNNIDESLHTTDLYKEIMRLLEE
jgi:hypothetical protein